MKDDPHFSVYGRNYLIGQLSHVARGSMSVVGNYEALFRVYVGSSNLGSLKTRMLYKPSRRHFHAIIPGIIAWDAGVCL